MACQHIFVRDEVGEVTCSICHAYDDEMELPKKFDLPEVKAIKGFPTGDDDFWNTQVSFE